MPVQPLPNGQFRAYDRDFNDALSAEQYQAARDAGHAVVHPAAAAPRLTKSPSAWWLVLLLPLALGAYLLVLGAALPPDATSTERGAIDLCWKDQARKSLTPAEQRLIAKACERMTATFKQTHGVDP